MSNKIKALYEKFIHRQDEIMITYVEEFNVPI